MAGQGVVDLNHPELEDDQAIKWLLSQKKKKACSEPGVAQMTTATTQTRIFVLLACVMLSGSVAFGGIGFMVPEQVAAEPAAATAEPSNGLAPKVVDLN